MATVIGLAFKLRDPEGLLGDRAKTDYGITCVLLPADHPGVQIGRRHYPGAAFMNGPIFGRDVFVPLDWIIGGPKMAPAISPKKSWEGLGGSLLFGITASVLSVLFLLDKPWWVGVPLGLLLVITGVLGDLVESQVKRDLGIKDMGSLLPGHGGIMDRIDAMLPSAVVAWIVLTLLA